MNWKKFNSWKKEWQEEIQKIKAKFLQEDYVKSQRKVK